MRRSLLLAAIFLACVAPALAQNTLFPANPGDMIVKGGASAWVPVPGGTAGCVLTSNGPAAAPTWQCALALNFQLPPMATNRVWGNVSGIQAPAAQITISQFLNTIDYDVQRPPLPGSVPYKGTDNEWHTATPSPVAGWVFTSQGAALAPRWAPASATVAVPIDGFTLAGQSNNVGDGDATLSCTLPSGVAYQYYNGALTALTGDPVGNASTGSAWPCFALAYYNATGHKILFIPTAVGSSAQTAAADTGAGNWDVSGTLYALSVEKTNAALTVAAAAGYAVNYKGVLWNQGETDAFGITGGLITQDQYKIAFFNMIQRYRTQYGAQMPFYLFRIGQPLAAPTAGFDAIRSGQEDIMSIDKYGKVVFRAAVDFPALGMMNVDGLHYLQNGLNFMGQVGAMNVVSANAHNGWQTYECPYNICVPNRASEMTWYANGPVGIGPGSSAGLISSLDAAVPPSLLYLIDTGATVKQQIIRSSGTGGAGIELKALGAGGRDWGIISAANGATDCGGGTFCLYDYTAGGPRLSINTTGGVRMFTYGAGVLFFDPLGNINVVGSPISGTKTVRAAGGAADCTLVFSVGVLTGGTC